MPPARAPDALLRYLYDGAGQRVIKTAEDTAGAQSHTVYLLSTLELRRTWWTAAAPGTAEDYALTPATESVILPAGCLLYTSDAADERSSVDLGGRRIIKKKT